MKNILYMIFNLLINISKYFDNLAGFINKLSANKVEIVDTIFDRDLRSLKFTISNLPGLERLELLEAVFYALTSNSEFNKFGFNKVIILEAVTSAGITFNYHPNVLINNKTTLSQYIKIVKDHISELYEVGSGGNSDKIVKINVLVWNMDNELNKNIKTTKSTFNPNMIKRKYSTKKVYKGLTHINNVSKDNILSTIGVSDIETINFGGEQLPIAITVKLFNNVCKILYIDHNNTSILEAVNKMWSDYFKYLENNFTNGIIFTHNLGGFDGYYIYKYLSSYADPKKK